MAEDQITENVEYLEQATNTVELVSTATPTINSEQFGSLNITALAVAITSVTVTGTPKDLQSLVVRILSPGAHAIAWGAQFEPVGAALPVITVAGKRHTVYFLYDLVAAKWGAVQAIVEA